MEKNYTQEIISWQKAWQYSTFRKKTISGIIILVGILIFLPFFFIIIEQRKGIELNDFVLNILPAKDLSVPIFIIIWLIGGLTFYRSIINPQVFILYLWSFILVTLCRIVTISFVPLEPPYQLILLVDPLSNTFYGGKFITKDLFFSGHTGTLFLSFLCLQKKLYKWLALAGTIAVGSMLLIQHVHYTVDVLLAPLFTFLMFWLAEFYIVKT